VSIDLIVYLRRAAMPTPEQWQQAIRAAGFPVDLDTDFEVDTFTGFLPCKFRGADTGFEYFSEEVKEQDRVEAGLPPGTDFAVTLVTHSDLGEFATSLLAAGALCHASSGLLVDPQLGESCASEQVLAWVAEVLSELEPHLG
jgi:hypothetical protein